MLATINNRKNNYLKSALITAIFMFSCSTYKAARLPAKTIEDFTSWVKKDDIILAAEVYSDSAKIKDMFYLDISKKNFIPIFIYLENNSTSDVLIKRNNIKLNYYESLYDPINSRELAKIFESPTLIYILFPQWGLGSLIASLSERATNRHLARDWQQKELAEVTIPSGGYTQGFLFFKFPAAMNYSGAFLQVTVEKLPGLEPISLIIGLR